MANSIKSKLKRMGSKRRSKIEDTTQYSSSMDGSRGSSLRSSGSTIARPDSSISDLTEAVSPDVTATTSNAKESEKSVYPALSAAIAANSDVDTGAAVGSEPPAPPASAGSTSVESSHSFVPESTASMTPSTSTAVAAALETASASASTSTSASTSAPAPAPAAEIKTAGGKQYVFQKKNPSIVHTAPSSSPAAPVAPVPVAVHTPRSAFHSPHHSHSASPAPGSRHPTFLVDQKDPKLPRNGSRIALSRTPSMAQIARDHKAHNLSTNDTRIFFNQNSSDQHIDRPSISRGSSYVDDKRAMEYIANKNPERTAENSNLMFRTSSRIWDANKESDMWFGYESRSHISSRRQSVTSSASEQEDENLHPGRFISRAGSFDSVEQDDEPEFADSLLIRAADWLLGIPHDSPNTLRNSLKRKPKQMSLLEKRRLRETNLASDPAFLMAAYLSLTEALR